MSREIKFRAWDDYSKSFIEDDEYLIGLNGKFYRMDFYSGVENYEEGNLVWNELQNITLSQFTGLLDKNGKEIFEGDLLQYDGYNFKLINKEKIYQIKYDDNLAQYYSYNLENSFDTFLVVRAWKESKIIGNIYQNPELLGGENE